MAKRPKKTAPKPAANRPASPRRDIQTLLNPMAAALRGAVLRQGEAERTPVKPLPRPPARKTPARTARRLPPRSPLAPASFPKMPPVAGVELVALEAGIRYRGRPDLLAAFMPPGTSAAGVFTQSKTAAAPVDWCRSNLDGNGGGGKARMLVVNAGNANAFTGKAGNEAVKAIAAEGARIARSRQKDVYIASTGVIGERLPAHKITARLEGMRKRARSDRWQEAADAMRTTDTFPKGATATALIDDVPVTINGIAKGSGMIAPDMATMLAFIFTDASIPPAVLQTMLYMGTRDSFNAITVDGDTSTSDTVMLFATGAAPGHGAVTRAGDRRLADFRRKLNAVMRDLALQIVRDGEGATRLVRVEVTGAASAKAARNIALSIANSPLVKTAVAGGDPNWGRVVMAVGKAGEAADRDKLSIRFGEHEVARDGQAAPGYRESEVAAYMKGREIAIGVDVGVGRGRARIYTCDLTQEYIKINASYRS
ncbi:MAG: bifunctional glutamate N-acetyltransferase/amino-acid acetyltransferase ArgJ [Alphaproteobacteria bacterium]